MEKKIIPIGTNVFLVRDRSDEEIMEVISKATIPGLSVAQSDTDQCLFFSLLVGERQGRILVKKGRVYTQGIGLLSSLHAEFITRGVRVSDIWQEDWPSLDFIATRFLD